VAAPVAPIDSIDAAIAAKFDAFQEHPDTAAELRADLDHAKPAPPVANEPEEIPFRALNTGEQSPEEEEETQPEAEADEAATEEAPAEETEDQINTLAELAGVYEVEEAEFAQHLQIEGPDGSMHPLQDALTAFREGPTESSAIAAAVEAHTAETRAAIDAQMAKMVDTTKHLLVRIQRDEQVDWEALKTSDPSGYIEKMEQHNLDKAHAQQAFEAFDQEDARRQKENEEALDTRRKEQARIILRRMSSWRDEKVAAAATEDMQHYLNANGFSEGDFDSLVDANQIITVWKAAQFDKLQAKIKKPGAIKRLRGLPTRKSLAATARSEAPSVDTDAKKRQGMVDSLRNSGNEADLAALLMELS